MAPKYFEDFKVGEILRGGPYTVSREEILQFAREFDPQPFHLDEAAANASVFGGLTASGAHTVALQIKLIHQCESRDQAVLAALGWDEVRFPKPVRPGDTLSLCNECIETRASETKPDRGIARMRIELVNQKGETVLTSVHTILVARRRDEDGRRRE
jgi:acyl dehydratase